MSSQKPHHEYHIMPFQVYETEEAAIADADAFLKRMNDEAPEMIADSSAKMGLVAEDGFSVCCLPVAGVADLGLSIEQAPELLSHQYLNRARISFFAWVNR